MPVRSRASVWTNGAENVAGALRVPRADARGLGFPCGVFSPFVLQPSASSLTGMTALFCVVEM